MPPRTGRTAVTASDAPLKRFLLRMEQLWPQSTNIIRTIHLHDEWLRQRKTKGVSWYDISSDNLDEIDNDADGSTAADDK